MWQHKTFKFSPLIISMTIPNPPNMPLNNVNTFNGQDRVKLLQCLRLSDGNDSDEKEDKDLG